MLDKIPPGSKNNVYYVINNQLNIEKSLSGDSAKYRDDCGAWESKKGHTAKTVFLLNSANNALKYCAEKDNMYHYEKTESGKRRLVPFDPQPPKDKIVTMHRYYATLKLDSSYKRRIAWFEGLPEHLQNKIFSAVIEYHGSFAGSTVPHGNAKQNEHPYIRTDPVVLNNIKSAIKTQKPTDAYDALTKHDDSILYPRDLKQVQNIKHSTCDFWTNNNDESMNNRLKQAIRWKPLKSDGLIEKIYGVVPVQFVDLRRAMYDSGSFSVSHRYKRFKMNEAVWPSKSEEEKKTVFEKFLESGVLKKPKTVVSTDGTYEVKKTHKP